MFTYLFSDLICILMRGHELGRRVPLVQQCLHLQGLCLPADDGLQVVLGGLEGGAHLYRVSDLLLVFMNPGIKLLVTFHNFSQVLDIISILLSLFVNILLSTHSSTHANKENNFNRIFTF